MKSFSTWAYELGSFLVRSYGGYLFDLKKRGEFDHLENRMDIYEIFALIEKAILNGGYAEDYDLRKQTIKTNTVFDEFKFNDPEEDIVIAAKYFNVLYDETGCYCSGGKKILENKKQTRSRIRRQRPIMEAKKYHTYLDVFQAIANAMNVDITEIEDDMSSYSLKDKLDIIDIEYIDTSIGEFIVYGSYDVAEYDFERKMEEYIDEVVMPEIPKHYHGYFDSKSFISDVKMYDGIWLTLSPYNGDFFESDDMYIVRTDGSLGYKKS